MTDATHLDGNGVAGLLQEILVAEPTAAERICPACGSRHAAGAHRAYQSAGVVLRCPSCGDVAALVAPLPEHNVVELRGRWILRRPGPG